MLKQNLYLEFNLIRPEKRVSKLKNLKEETSNTA
jgi:hypothetical protein